VHRGAGPCGRRAWNAKVSMSGRGSIGGVAAADPLTTVRVAVASVLGSPPACGERRRRRGSMPPSFVCTLVTPGDGQSRWAAPARVRCGVIGVGGSGSKEPAKTIPGATPTPWWSFTHGYTQRWVGQNCQELSRTRSRTRAAHRLWAGFLSASQEGGRAAKTGRGSLV
jgi:hypothetical protein